MVDAGFTAPLVVNILLSTMNKLLYHEFDQIYLQLMNVYLHPFLQFPLNAIQYV